MDIFIDTVGVIELVRAMELAQPLWNAILKVWKQIFFTFFSIKATYVKDILKKKMKNVIRNLVNKWFKIVFPKIRCFFCCFNRLAVNEFYT